MERELSGAARRRRARGPREHRERTASPPRSFSSFLRPLLSTVAHCVRLYPMPQPWIASANDAAQPRLRLAGCVQSHVTVRRGFGLGAEARRKVGGRHVYFVKRRARERADELQCL